MDIKKRLFISLISAVSIVNLCTAQDDNLKSFLYLSVFCQKLFSYETANEVVCGFDRRYSDFSFKCTKPIEIPVSEFLNDSEKYTIQLFKIVTDTLSPSYYILKFGPCITFRLSFKETLWIRISGYRESDIKVFFDALKKQGLSKKEIMSMVELWCKEDELFQEIDWKCIMHGYIKNNTHSDCFLSDANIWYYLRYHGEEKDLYSIFSEKPLAGSITRYL